ncbi:hypothetical protein [Haliscomenobacter sp.]|uniref:hypothetical protein n=1 Tax=Haliscomenobacter sp. TaxID=2717303 RepID=UPI003364F7C8
MYFYHPSTAFQKRFNLNEQTFSEFKAYAAQNGLRGSTQEWNTAQKGPVLAEQAFVHKF